jgi:hypothetical protein
LTPTHRESDTTVRRGRITKQGSRLVRWAAVEAVQRVPAHTRLGQVRDRVGARRGRNIGVVSAARELLGLVFYGLRDHHIRCLPAQTRAQADARAVARADARAGVAWAARSRGGRGPFVVMIPEPARRDRPV